VSSAFFQSLRCEAFYIVYVARRWDFEEDNGRGRPGRRDIGIVGGGRTLFEVRGVGTRMALPMCVGCCAVRMYVLSCPGVSGSLRVNFEFDYPLNTANTLKKSNPLVRQQGTNFSDRKMHYSVIFDQTV
jgi:hypothetical protein